MRQNLHLYLYYYRFGWYGFNPGSSIYIATAASGDVSSLAAVNTTLGSAAGALSGMFTSTVVDERKTGGKRTMNNTPLMFQA